MAYLNVRERRIEATIAYVGPELAGKATNFDHLLSATETRFGKVEGSKDRLSLAWQPAGASPFRDCDVHVQLVAQRGRVSTALTDDVLRDADGVVVIMDADPAAEERNRESLAAVLHLLARGERRDVPVVLQVNKSDLPGARAAAEVVGKLEATGLRHVVASARSGEGVVETLEAALEEVLLAMQSPAGREDHAPTNGTLGAPGDGGHPLLAALRQVLRDTVRDHVEQLEVRLASGIERSFARLDGLLSRIEQRSATKSEVEALGLRVERLRDELKADLVRALEVRGRADREHLATVAAGLKKSVDGLANEVRVLDVNGHELATRVDELGGRVDAGSSYFATVVPRLDEIESSVEQQTARLDTALRTVRAELSEGRVTTGEKLAAVHTSVSEIVEELKKPKKSWFT